MSSDDIQYWLSDFRFEDGATERDVMIWQLRRDIEIGNRKIANLQKNIITRDTS